MKNKISILLLSLITVFAFTACEDEQEVFDGPYRLSVGGPGSATPETTATYTLGDIQNPDSYTWSVEGPAQIVGAASGATVEVEFLSVGEVVLSVTNGTDFRNLSIEVEEVDPVVTAFLDTLTTGQQRALRSGQSDTLYLTFDAAVESIGSIQVTGDSTQFNEGNPFESGSIGSLQRTGENSFYAIYTAGEGNGIPEAAIYDIVATDIYGGTTVDTAYVQLYRVDNIAPTANISYDPSVANDSTVVNVTVTFSEPVVSPDPADSALLISFSGAGVAAETDTLMPTDDPRVYTYSYVVNGEGNGTVDVELSNIQDFAGNELNAVTYTSLLKVDNQASSIVIAEANDIGEVARIRISSTEAGTGMYLIVEDDATAPTTPEEFMNAEGVAAGSVALSGDIAEASIAEEIIASGSYTVYFLATDRAGNFSSIESANLVMD